MTDKDREQECQRQIAAGGGGNIIEKFRAQLMIRKVSGIKSIGRMFKIMDDDGNFTLNYDEFKKGVQERVKIKDDEVRQLFEFFDKDGTGTVEYKEFLREIRPPMSEARIRLINKAFDKMDKDGSGQITDVDLKGVYDVKDHPKYKNGEWTASQVYQNFLKTFDTEEDPDGIVTRDDFINYYAGVSMSIDSDAYFDLMMRNSWGI